jgi:transcription-repair coupling factor (superfamily II helicase)
MASSNLAQELRGLVEADPAFADAVEALGAGRRVVMPDLPAGAQTLLLAALARKRPLLIVAPAEDELPSLEEDLRALLGDDGGALLRNPSLDLADDGDVDRVERDERDEHEEDPDDPELVEALGPSPGLGARLRVLVALQEQPAPAVVLSGITSLLERVPEAAAATRGIVEIKVGHALDPHALAAQLVQVGHARVPLVEAPGEFAIRGGIMDVFSIGAATPVRIELLGEEVESIRRFEVGSQRSIETLDRLVLPFLSAGEYVRLRRLASTSLLAHLPEGTIVVLRFPARCRERLVQGAKRFAGRARDLLTPAQVEVALGKRPLLLLGEGAAADPLGQGAADLDLPIVPADTLGAGRDPSAVTNEVARAVGRGERLTVACLTEAEKEHLAELLTKSGLAPESVDRLRTRDDPPGVTLITWPLDGGFRVAASGVWLVASHRLFARHRRGEAVARRPRGRFGGGHQTIESFADLEEGQPVVHVSYGIAIFRGIVRRDRDGQPRDFLELELDGGSVFMPTDRIGLVRRYVGPSGTMPKLSKLGGTAWKAKTKKAAEAARDLAAELLEVQAERRLRSGHALPPDDRDQILFEESFAYTDTEDQARVTTEVKGDLERPMAMDRLVCGDVGYGKTEIAVRAAFKVAQAGKQVAVLVPTTVLAHQHGRVFSERMAQYPLRVDVVSRFRTPAESKKVLKDAKAGQVDILIGTHRLLSKDVAFKDLGLVVIDEEQRFGVEHKEKLKALKRTVHVLTLSATPIPRTLHMALSGARDISLLQTPPPGRAPVETKVARFSRGLVRRAIERELARDGQVFVVHDRVKSIEPLADLIRELVPTARVLVVHGQLPEHEIEERMLAFVDHQADVLVATTLIENGLDIRRANTLIVDRAHHYGLSELHQLRGRVGRSDVRAYAYVLIPEHGNLTDIAGRRLRALEEFSDLGAGFQIALRDLEIRGAGNVLGAEQSGHIANVGYDLYCRLLKRAMAELQGRIGQAPGDGSETPLKELDLEHDLDLEAGEIELALDVSAYVPDAYVADVALKIECYRKLASADREDELEQLEGELRDRYGPLPEVLSNLFKLRTARIRAAGHGIVKITRQDRVLQLKCRDHERLAKGIRAHKNKLRPIDPTMLYLVIDPQADDAALLDLLLEVLRPLDGPVEPDDTAPEQPAESEEAKRERQRRLRARGARRRGRARSK